MQQDLFPEMSKNKDDNIKMISANLSLVFNRRNKQLVTFKNRDVIVKKVDLSDKPAKKLLIVEAVELGATKSQLAGALKISRQTVDNYIDSKKKFGTEGLLGGYNPNMGKNLAEYRRLTQQNRIQGNKAVILAEERKAKRIENQKKQQEFDFEFGPKTVPKGEQPFNPLHDWKFTRFAGIFPYLIVLISKNQWQKLIMGYFGSAYKIFLVFLLMAARNIKSIEQLKNVNQKEAGLVLGLGKLPHVKGVWQWFYAACNLRRSTSVCKSFFKQQLVCGLVSAWIWFTDGHLLPYTGNKKVHSGFNTQRKMMMPGQTNIVTCDMSGRIVDFQIQEEVQTVPGTDGQKMSKSYGNTVNIFGEEKKQLKTIKKIVTQNVAMEEPKEFEDCNVYNMAKLFLNDNELLELQNRYTKGGEGHGHFKLYLGEVMWNYFGEFREKRNHYLENQDEVREILRQGASKASAIARPMMEKIRAATGVKY